MAQTNKAWVVECAETKKRLYQLSEIDSFLKSLRDASNADALKCQLSDVYDDALSTWARLTEVGDMSGDDLISDQEIALAADRRDDVRGINAENRRIR